MERHILFKFVLMVLTNYDFCEGSSRQHITLSKDKVKYANYFAIYLSNSMLVTTDPYITSEYLNYLFVIYAL